MKGKNAVDALQKFKDALNDIHSTFAGIDEKQT